MPATAFDIANWKARWTQMRQQSHWNDMADGSWDMAAAIKSEIAERILRAELQGAMAAAGPVERAELEAVDSWSRTRESIGLLR